MDTIQIKPADFPSCVDLFGETILQPNCIKSLRELSLNGELGNSPLRAMAWRIFLGVMPENQTVAQWITALTNKRNEYKKKSKKFLTLKKFSGDPLGAMSATPNTEKTQDWKSYYSDNEIKKIITLDLNRTYQEIDLFLQNTTKTLLSNILFIWSKENEDVSYKQGMNELLAVIYLAFYPYYFKNKYKKKTEELIEFTKTNYGYDKKNELFSFFFDSTELEADLFAVFDILMSNGIKDFFDVSESEKRMANYNFKKHNLFNNALTSSNEENNTQTPLNYRCYFIMNDILKNTDEQLYEHFKRIRLEGNIFLQEFEYFEVFFIWDAIFAHGTRDDYFTYIDYMAVALIVNLRNDLLESDQNECLTYFFKYPHQDSLSLLNIIAENIELVYKEKYKGNLINDISKINIGKLTLADFTLKHQVTESIATGSSPSTSNSSSSNVPSYSEQREIPEETKKEKKGFLGFVKDIGKKLKGDDEKEHIEIQPVSNKYDALDRLERIQNRYKGKMRESDSKEFAMALSYLKNNI